MTPIVRFAPSPTGYLHVGNIRTAAINWLFAQKLGGKFLLRLDDTDRERSKDEYAQGIRDDLAWLNIHVDAEFRQSERMARYEAIMAQLVTMGRIYPCYETAQELDIKRKIQLSRGLPPVYDRAALALSAEERAALKAEGKTPHWRFKLDTTQLVRWIDLVRGDSHIDMASLSDPVVRRADGSFLYMLPSVIDDIDYKITHVIRGEDHVANSAVQVQMFEALGTSPPHFAHLALLTGADGELSKRLGSAGVAHYKSIGVEPLALIALLARLGTSDPIEPVTDIAPLIDHFDFAKFGRAIARFDEAELKQLNAKILHHTDFSQVRDRLPAAITEAEWLALRGNVDTLQDIDHWHKLITGPVQPVLEQPEFLAVAKDSLTSLPWSTEVWRELTEALKAKTGRKGKDLFHPLRLALTGEAQGPNMAQLLPLIGREKALARLAGESA
jgi:glutamyl-tRNA synthetase